MTPWKRDKILQRDQNKCRLCGSARKLRIIPLIPIPSRMKSGSLPSVVQALVCRKCEKLLRSWKKKKKVKDPESEFEKYCQVYHGGVFQAEQYIMNLKK